MTCPTCSDARRVWFDDRSGIGQYSVACWECPPGQRAMGIGPLFYGAEVSAKDPVGRQVHGWDGAPPGWYLHGAVGRGKTYLAAAVCRDQASKGRAARFLSSARLLALIKATFDSNPTEDRESARFALNRYAEAEVVVLDDLGAEHNTEWAEAELTEWIDGFYERGAALVVTSNLSFEALIQRLGQRIASRIIGMTVPLELTGPDRRLQRPARPVAATQRDRPDQMPESCREATPQEMERARQWIGKARDLAGAKGAPWVERRA